MKTKKNVTIITMAMLRSHMLRTREFLGQFEAEQLILWLQVNEFPKTKRHVTERDRTAEFNRVAKLLHYMQKVEDLRESQLKPTKEDLLDRIPLLRNINQMLSRYSYKLRILDSLETQWVQSKSSAIQPSEEKAAMHMALLSDLGVLRRVRPCGWCTSWFFARYDHQKYCKQVCQQKAYAASPDWRKHRREYMRKYRRLISRKSI